MTEAVAIVEEVEPNGATTAEETSADETPRDDDPMAKAKAELAVMRRQMENLSKLPVEAQHRVLNWLRSTIGAPE